MSTTNRSIIATLAIAVSLTVNPPLSAQDAKPTVPHFAGPREDAPIPRPGMTLQKGRVGLVITDPQNDFLSPKGVAWAVVGKSVEENDTVENIETLFQSARSSGVPAFVSPHYYYPHDHQWKFGGALEVLMHRIGMFDRKGTLNHDGFAGSGADWLDRYKRYIDDGKTVVTSPHKVFGPESNDLVLQLRKAGVSQVILGGMSANLCTESHLRELLEQGFEVVVVTDATAAAKLPGFDGYEAAFVNFRLLASDVWSTSRAVGPAAREAAHTRPHTWKERPVNTNHGPDAGMRYRFEHLSLPLVMRDLTFDSNDPGPGDPVPPFDLPTVSGGRFRSTDLAATGPALLIFGSITCPVTDDAAPGLNELYRRFGDRVRFVMVNVREAHPGATFPQPRTADGKMAHARRMRDLYGFEFDVAVDDPDGTLHRALGPKPNSAYVVAAEGTILFRAHWGNDTAALFQALEAVTAGRPVRRSRSGGLVMFMVRMLRHIAPVLDRAGAGAWADMWRVAPPLAAIAAALKALGIGPARILTPAKPG